MLDIWFVVAYKVNYPSTLLGHLDLMYCLERAIRIHNLPVNHTEGFNPQIKISSMDPIPLGTTAKNELLFISFKEQVNPKLIINLNRHLPQGMAIKKAVTLKTSKKSFINKISNTIYSYGFTDSGDAKKALSLLQSQSNINFQKKDKTTLLNLQDFINNSYIKDNMLIISIIYKKERPFPIKAIHNLLIENHLNFKEFTKLGCHFNR